MKILGILNSVHIYNIAAWLQHLARMESQLYSANTDNSVVDVDPVIAEFLQYFDII